MVLKRKKTQKLKAKTQRNKLEYRALKRGDLIEVIAPGSSAPPEHLSAGISFLKNWGFDVVVDEHLLKPELFLANSDKNRFQHFKNSMLNKKSKAVWCLRGGYGAIRLLPMIEKMTPPKEKKILIGISDISSLHILINQKWKMPTLHAPLLDRLGLGKLSEANAHELLRVLTDPSYITVFSHLKPLNAAAKKNKKIKSQVVGGNLMVVTSTLGTKSQFRGKNKILFFEELSERSYRIDRCLQQLKQAGVFDEAAAVVFGDFINCEEPNNVDLLPDTLKNFFQEMKIPAFIGIESGHGDRQRPLFFNTETHLTCGDKPEMLVYSPFKK